MNDYKVKDISLAELGRQEIIMAQDEMPALMSLRAEYKDLKPLKGAKIIGCIHIIAQTAVLIELYRAGAEADGHHVIFFPRTIAAAIADKGIPVFAWKVRQRRSMNGV